MGPIILGGNIELNGFGSVDAGSMIILKKIIGSYARKFSDSSDKFEKLMVEMKLLDSQYEVISHLHLGESPITAADKDQNLFVVVDKVMKKIEGSI